MKKIIIIILIAFCASQIFISDFYLDYFKKNSGSQPDIFYLPEAKFIKPVVLGYDYLAADIIWIKTISYFADQFTSGRDFRYLEKLLYIVMGLDPMFEKVAIWGGSILLYNGNVISKERVLRANKFLATAWENIKNQNIKYRHDSEYWRIPQMIGFNYAIELRDPKSGVPYIEEVAKIEGSPGMYKTWISTLYKKAGEEDKAVKILERELIIENLKTALMQDIDNTLKMIIINRLRKFYKDVLGDVNADEKIEALNQKVEVLRRIYMSDLPYVPLSMFFVLNADEILAYTEDKAAQKVFYSGL
jgi:hypothetical protein